MDLLVKKQLDHRKAWLLSVEAAPGRAEHRRQRNMPPHSVLKGIGCVAWRRLGRLHGNRIQEWCDLTHCLLWRVEWRIQATHKQEMHMTTTEVERKGQEVDTCTASAQGLELGPKRNKKETTEFALSSNDICILLHCKVSTFLITLHKHHLCLAENCMMVSDVRICEPHETAECVTCCVFDIFLFLTKVRAVICLMSFSSF